MNPKLYNTETRKKEVVVALDGKSLHLYTCGPTVYDFAHIGNLRTYVFEDLLRRTLEFFDFKVVQVMNITDVDDKTIKRAIEKDLTLEEYTKPYKKAFFEDIKTLGIQKARHYPEATAYIDAMIEIIADLLEKKIAYKSSDGSIYFSIKKFPKYGRLSHLKLDELKLGAAEGVFPDEYEKNNASDFVLWKKYDPKRDGKIFWDSPYGKGRPGWHLECSAMAIKLLGKTIDIHCGGVDNIFPHHENEIAQSESYTGTIFVNYWVHCEHLIVNNKKMSKSLNNFFVLDDLIKMGYSGKQVRYMLLQTHYRTQLNFTIDGLAGAKASLERFSDFIFRLRRIEDEKSYDKVNPLLEKAYQKFVSSLADDLNISTALASLFDLLREINSLCDKKQIGNKEAKEVIKFLQKVDKVLACLPLEEDSIPSAIIEAVEKREIARKEKKWALADELRDFISSEGYLVEDTPKGAQIKKKQ
jgi:cysteinyl-tRNA synthetase